MAQTIAVQTAESVVENYIDAVWNEGACDPVSLAAFVALDYVGRDTSLGEVRGAAALGELVEAVREAFPGLRYVLTGAEAMADGTLSADVAVVDAVTGEPYPSLSRRASFELRDGVVVASRGGFDPWS
jgi:hypothetical protein